MLLAANLTSDFWKAAVPCITTLCVYNFTCLPLSMYQEEELPNLPAGNLRLAEAAREKKTEKEAHSWYSAGGFHHSPAWVGCSYLSPLSASADTQLLHMSDKKEEFSNCRSDAQLQNGARQLLLLGINNSASFYGFNSCSTQDLWWHITFSNASHKETNLTVPGHWADLKAFKWVSSARFAALFTG